MVKTQKEKADDLLSARAAAVAERARLMRRKKFLKEAKKSPNGKRRARRKKFTIQAKKEYKKLKKEDIKERKVAKRKKRKDPFSPKSWDKTFKRYEEMGHQITDDEYIKVLGDIVDKNILYRKAKKIKKRDGRSEAISTYNKLKLQRYVLKYE